MLRQHQSSPEWGSYVKEILAEGINRPKKGKDVGDHPPITPMKATRRSDLDGDSWKLYDYIVRHFLATVSIFITILDISDFKSCMSLTLSI